MESLDDESNIVSVNAYVGNELVESNDAFDEAKLLAIEVGRIMKPFPAGYLKQTESVGYVAMPAQFDRETIEVCFRGKITSAVQLIKETKGTGEHSIIHGSFLIIGRDLPPAKCDDVAGVMKRSVGLRVNGRQLVDQGPKMVLTAGWPEFIERHSVSVADLIQLSTLEKVTSQSNRFLSSRDSLCNDVTNSQFPP